MFCALVIVTDKGDPSKYNNSGTYIATDVYKSIMSDKYKGV